MKENVVNTIVPPVEPKLGRALAAALAEQPKITLQELAKAVGVSRATLYRLAATREELLTLLDDYSLACVKGVFEQSDLSSGTAREAFQRLIAAHIQQREFCAYLISRTGGCEKRREDMDWGEVEQHLQQLFLRGQQAGEFRIDLPAAWMADMFGYFVLALCEGEGRGRVPRASMAQYFETFFLFGAQGEALS